MQRQRSYRDHARAILVLGLPLIGSHLAQILIGVTDTVMMGWYGVTELAALVLGSTFFLLMFLLGSGFANAVMPMVAEAAASGNERQVRRVARMALWLSLAYAVLIVPVFLWSGTILRFLGQEPQVADLAQLYLRIAVAGMGPALITMVLKSYLSALERTVALLWVTIGAAVINGIANYALIFGNWGFPELGVAGAGIASVVSNLLAALALAVHVARATPEHALFHRFWRSDWEALGRVFRLGWPISLTMLSEVGLFSASAIMVGWVGTTELAAHGIALQLAAITFMVHLGLSGVATIRVGRAVGRGDQAGLADGGRVVTALSVLFALVAALVFLGFPEALIDLFLDPAEPARAEILRIGAILLALAAVFQLADGAQAIGLGLLRGVQDTRAPMVIAGVSYWGVGATCSYVLSQPLGLGAPGVWIGLVAGLTCAAVLLNLRFWRRLAGVGAG